MRDVDQRLKSITTNAVRSKENIKRSNIEQFNEMKDSLALEFNTKLQTVSTELSSVNDRVEELMNDQEELCKESSNLLTNICMKEQQGDERYKLLVQKLAEFETKTMAIFEEFEKAEKEKKAPVEHLTRKDMNEYFVGLKQALEEKVGLHEVQLALNEMQGKLQISLVKSSQAQYEALTQLKKSFGMKFKKFSENGSSGAAHLSKNSFTSLMNKEDGPHSIPVLSANGVNHPINTQSLVVMIEEIENLKSLYDLALTKEGKFFSKFFAFRF
jgi:hypothetical protein